MGSTSRLNQKKNSSESLSVFALIGYQLFHGSLRHKCVIQPNSTVAKAGFQNLAFKMLYSDWLFNQYLKTVLQNFRLELMVWDLGSVPNLKFNNTDLEDYLDNGKGILH